MRPLAEQIPPTWRSAIAAKYDFARLAPLEDFLRAERERGSVFPPEEALFAALALTPPERIKAVIVGQDPYHDEGQAHGLAFSVPPGVTPPPSLRNIFKELANDLGLPLPGSGDLRPWAKAGVLLLNSVLTVRAHEAASHRGHGWEALTDAILAAASDAAPPAVFLLWGNDARAKAPLIDRGKHMVIESAHPSPLSAARGFFGSRPFSRTNQRLRACGREPIDWSLPPAAGALC